MATAALATTQANWRITPWETFGATLNRDHPDIGRIWSIADNRMIAPTELIDRLATSKDVLLGELHDNPDHHRLQAFVIAELVTRGRRPHVVMEMIGKDKAAALAAYLATPEASANGLGDALDWSESGWPPWSDYQPIAEAALSAGLVLVAGDPPRAEMRGITKDGASALSPMTAEQLRLDRPFPPEHEAALRDEIKAAHCNMLPERAMGKFVLLQRLRDGHLAKAMRDGNGDGAILIAGGGHVRKDRAVPSYLDTPAAVVVFAEAVAGLPLSAAYAATDTAGRPVVDYVWLTPGMPRPDPCEEMRRAMEKRKSE